MTSNDLEKPQMTSNGPVLIPVKSKNKMKGATIAENNENFLDEIHHNNNL